MLGLGLRHPQHCLQEVYCEAVGGARWSRGGWQPPTGPSQLGATQARLNGLEVANENRRSRSDSPSWEDGEGGCASGLLPCQRTGPRPPATPSPLQDTGMKASRGVLGPGEPGAGRAARCPKATSACRFQSICHWHCTLVHLPTVVPGKRPRSCRCCRDGLVGPRTALPVPPQAEMHLARRGGRQRRGAPGTDRKPPSPEWVPPTTPALMEVLAFLGGALKSSTRCPQRARKKNSGPSLRAHLLLPCRLVVLTQVALGGDTYLGTL